ncbi:DUF371 domain-containing protein, partial [Candidatus Woesearchaeota archaeon]|nr:DUF371 domain-containing protein [Candidatus Woesearchaeota archaeon]
EVSRKGDCIIAVKSDFELEELRNFLSCKKIRIKIIIAGLKTAGLTQERTTAGLTEELTAFPNPGFSSNHEFVIRKTDFCSERTFAIKADKAAKDIDRRFSAALKNGSRINVSIGGFE